MVQRGVISSISWIPRGVSKSEPIISDPPSKDEIEEFFSTHVPNSTESVNEENAADADQIVPPNAVCDDITLALNELDLEHYDDEDQGIQLFRSRIDEAYYASNDMDPYIIDNNDDDSEELEDMIIDPTDSVIVCARSSKNPDYDMDSDLVDCLNHLEVSILEDSELNMYSHHKIVIPSSPLCMTWLDCPLKGGERGNFLAVGSMEPEIEIWDLDVIGELQQPCAVLDGTVEEKRKGKKLSIIYKDGHTDSVLGLAWNKEYRNILASASADKRVKIWDVVTGKCDITMEHHTDKVQAVAWNHHAPQVLLSGSFDRTVVMKDGRMPSHSGYKWLVTADVESLTWDPHTEHSFVVSLEDGIVKCFDVRTAKADSTSDPSLAAFTLHAHDNAVTSVSYNPTAPNLLATGSMDKTVKLWDLSNNQPSCVASKAPKVGRVFFISFSEDNPFLLAIGGSKGKLHVWNTLSDSGISRRYENYKNRPKFGS